MLLKADPDQSSKQTRVGLVLRGKAAGNGAGRQGQDSKALLANSLLPVSSPQDFSGKKTEPRTIHGAVFRIHRDLYSSKGVNGSRKGREMSHQKAEWASSQLCFPSH